MIKWVDDKMKRLFNNEKGFTLIEIIVTILLMSLLLSVTIINIQTNQDALLKKYANQLVQDIRNVRMKTIYEKTTGYKFYFGADHYKIMLHTNTLKKVEFHKDISYTSTYKYKSGGESLYFTLTGAPSRAGHIILTNRRGNKIEITVEVSTGRVRMREYRVK